MRGSAQELLRKAPILSGKRARNGAVKTLRAFFVAAAVSVALAAPAVADSDDPHIPDPVHDWCRGSGLGPKFGYGVCDGSRYPDGTYWHVQGFINQLVSVGCAAGTPGDLAPPPAPPGGCGGLPVPTISTQR